MKSQNAGIQYRVNSSLITGFDTVLWHTDKRLRWLWNCHRIYTARTASDTTHFAEDTGWASFSITCHHVIKSRHNFCQCVGDRRMVGLFTSTLRSSATKPIIRPSSFLLQVMLILRYYLSSQLDGDAGRWQSIVAAMQSICRAVGLWESWGWRL